MDDLGGVGQLRSAVGTSARPFLGLCAQCDPHLHWVERGEHGGSDARSRASGGCAHRLEARAHEREIELASRSWLWRRLVHDHLVAGSECVLPRGSSSRGAHALFALRWARGRHGVAIGGVVVDGGHFDWEASGKFPTLSEPYAGFDNMDFDEDFGPCAFAIRARREGLRDFGAALSPANAFYLLQGIETLSVRMQRHVSNTREIVESLSASDAVEYVTYPDLADHPNHELAKQLLPKGCGAVFSFELKGGRDAGKKFIESLQLFSHLANVGDAKSLVIHPASTTHARMDAQALAAAGISEGLVRLSIGIEDIEDLIDDLNRALYRSQK